MQAFPIKPHHDVLKRFTSALLYCEQVSQSVLNLSSLGEASREHINQLVVQSDGSIWQAMEPVPTIVYDQLGEQFAHVNISEPLI